MATIAELEVKVNEVEDDLDRLDNNLTGFAQELGQVQGKLEALDKRVEHNCARNEENFKNLDDKFTNLTAKINEFVQKNTEYIGDLKASNKTKLTIIVAFVLVIIAAFVGGSYISWHKIGDDFDKTTVQERAGFVRDTVETISKVIK